MLMWRRNKIHYIIEIGKNIRRCKCANKSMYFIFVFKVFANFLCDLKKSC